MRVPVICGLCLAVVARMLSAAGFTEDFAAAGRWRADNYKSRLTLTFGGTVAGVKGLVVANDGDKPSDTMWRLVSPRLDLARDRRGFEFSFELLTERPIYCGFVSRGENIVSQANYYRADGTLLAQAPFVFTAHGGRSRLTYAGLAPEGADSLELALGFDAPNVEPKESLVLADFRLSFKADGPAAGGVVLEKIERLPFVGVPKTTLRDDGVMLIDGKPFFPIGMYGLRRCDFNGNDWNTMFRQLKDVGFNMGMSYTDRHNPEFQDAAVRSGFRIFVNSEAAPNRRFWKDARCPAIVAWYTGDDTFRHKSPEEILSYHAAIHAVDPNRITVQAEHYDGTGFGNSYLSVFAESQDGFLPEVYPIRENTPAEASNCVAQVVRDVRGSLESLRRGAPGKPRCVWPIIQNFIGWNYNRLPTDRELTAMSFAALSAGAQGITWYTYPVTGGGKNRGVTATPETWKRMACVSSRIAELQDILVERTGVQPSAPRILEGPQRGLLEMPTVSYLLKVHDGTGYLIAVNTTLSEVKAAFDLSGVLPHPVSSATVRWEDRTVLLDGSRLVDRWEPFGVHVYEIGAAEKAPDVDGWHGVNLLGLFSWSPAKEPSARFPEHEFRWLSGWGFNFARLPVDYRYLMEANDWTKLKEVGFRKVDEAVAFGRKHGVHVQICLHRAPGYTIASWTKDTPLRLQTDREPQEAFFRIWREFARRYRGIPNRELTFNLVNEPSAFTDGEYIDVFGRTIEAIRAIDPVRFVMLDGNWTASRPVPHFYKVPLTGQSFRGYTPHAISHYGASYIKEQPLVEPVWPLSAEMATNKVWIYEQPETTMAKYLGARKAGYPIMIGEFGCYNKVAHATALAWMESCLKLWQKEGLGWAVWNLTGSFGFVDSKRSDVAYEDFEGHKLDRKMLELLRKYAVKGKMGR